MKRIPGVLFGLLITIGGVLLASCTTTQSIVLPSGQAGYTVDCSGTNLSWSHCYGKAGKLCPQGYVVTEKSDSHGGKPVVGDLYGVLSGSVVDRSLLIHCQRGGAVARAQPVPAIHPAVPTEGAKTFAAGDDSTRIQTTPATPASSALPASGGGA